MSCFFVRGLSRSGGTLMATILDAHPDVAMSYETYEHLIAPGDGTHSQLADILKKMKKDPLSILKRHLFSDSKEDANFTKFVGRAERAGIDHKTLARLFQDHFQVGLGLDSFRERMMFVERLTREKMLYEGKKYWGAKIVSTYDQLDELYPEARYLFMLRDGRDIAASRKKVGDFNQTIEHVANGWCRQIRKFEDFLKKASDRAFFVPYEKLAHDPESELKALMRKLGLPWSDRLLTFHQLNLSIHRNPTGHLSGKQVKSPINTSSIGRWKMDLTGDEIERFEKTAGETLKKLGYIT
jgi:hypothetical protein